MQPGLLSGYKTYIFGIVGIILVWAAYFLGVQVADQMPLSLPLSVAATLTLVMKMTTRSGITAEAAKNKAPILLACLMVFSLAGCSDYMVVRRDQPLSPATKWVLADSRLATFEEVLRTNIERGLVKPGAAQEIDPYIQAVRQHLAASQKLLPEGGDSFEELMKLIDTLLLTAEGLQGVDITRGRKTDVSILTLHHRGHQDGTDRYQNGHGSSGSDDYRSYVAPAGRRNHAGTVGRDQAEIAAGARRLGRPDGSGQRWHIHSELPGYRSGPGYVYPNRSRRHPLDGRADDRRSKSSGRMMGLPDGETHAEPATLFKAA